MEIMCIFHNVQKNAFVNDLTCIVIIIYVLQNLFQKTIVVFIDLMSNSLFEY